MPPPTRKLDQSALGHSSVCRMDFLFQAMHDQFACACGNIEGPGMNPAPDHSRAHQRRSHLRAGLAPLHLLGEHGIL